MSSSWFRRSCKEVLPANRDFNFEVGTDKVPTVSVEEGILWNGTPQLLAYCFLDGNDIQHGKVRDAIDEWTWYANVVFRETASAAESNIRIKFDSNDGNWSYVGRHCARVPVYDATMNLAWLDEMSTPLSATERAIVLHQFGHALGLIHEHQCPARGGISTMNVEAVIDLYTKTQGWSTQQIYDSVINLYNISDISNFSQTDTRSIMHCPKPKEMTGLPHDIPYNEKLTDLDIAYTILQYPRKSFHPKVSDQGWSFEKALAVVGVPDDIKTRILESLKTDVDESTGEISPENTRTRIGNWIRLTHRTIPNDHSAGAQPAKGSSPSKSAPPAPEGTTAEDGGSFVAEVHKKLSTLYCPGGDQYLSLQYPSCSLDKRAYSYNLEGGSSHFIKPLTIGEAEFRLSDALFPISPIVGGPTGETLSQNYFKALNSLIPEFDSATMRKQRERIRTWLLEDRTAVNTATDSVTSGQRNDNSTATENRSGPKSMTRIEYTTSLMQAYLQACEEWEEKKGKILRSILETGSIDSQATERMTREMAQMTTTEEGKLTHKYADAVVRGECRTVREMVGLLDIKATAEYLQDAKDAFRESAMSSMYSESRIYPVAMHPVDWFKALDTGFTSEDLSQDPALLQTAIRAKSLAIDTLETQIAGLRSLNGGDPQVAKQAMDEAVAKRENAVAELSQKYTALAIATAKLAIHNDTTGGPTEAAAARSLKALFNQPADDPERKSVADVLGADCKIWDDIGAKLDAVTIATAAVNSASRALTRQLSANIRASAVDKQTQIDSLQRQLSQAGAELANLEASYSISRQPKAMCKPLGEIGALPPSSNSSLWSEIHINSTVQNAYTSITNIHTSPLSSFPDHFWLGSPPTNKATAPSPPLPPTPFTLTASMRTAHITIDRSRWFDPSILSKSASFTHAASSDTYTPWCTYNKDSTPAQLLSAIHNNTADKPTGYLAAYPVGYVLVKDIVLKISTTDGKESQIVKKDFDEQARTSNGMLCFSYSASSTGPGNESSILATEQAEDGIVVRISGPQVLGYVMRVAPRDDSRPLGAVPDEGLILAENGGVAAMETSDAFAAPSVATASLSADTKKPGHLMDALKTALGDGEVAGWLGTQPEGTKDELWRKLSEVFGKVG